MWFSWFVAALAVVLALRFPNSVSSQGAKPTPGLSKDVDATECPDGHNELRHVPILYGKVSKDEQLERDLAERKCVLGGCVVGKDSPKTALICGKCGFRYRRDGIWDKSSTDPDAYGIEFSPVLQDFQKLFGSKETVYYDQSVKSKEILHQRVQFKCAENRKTLEVEVARLMKDRGISRQESRRDCEVYLGSDKNGNVYRVWILTDQGSQLLDLSISSQ